MGKVKTIFTLVIFVAYSLVFAQENEHYDYEEVEVYKILEDAMKVYDSEGSFNRAPPSDSSKHVVIIASSDFIEDYKRKSLSFSEFESYYNIDLADYSDEDVESSCIDHQQKKLLPDFSSLYQVYSRQINPILIDEQSRVQCTLPQAVEFSVKKDAIFVYHLIDTSKLIKLVREHRSKYQEYGGIDRLIINAHGSPLSIGNRSNGTFLTDNMLKEAINERSPLDSTLLSSKGEVILQSCETNGKPIVTPGEEEVNFAQLMSRFFKGKNVIASSTEIISDGGVNFGLHRLGNDNIDIKYDNITTWTGKFTILNSKK